MSTTFQSHWNHSRGQGCSRTCTRGLLVLAPQEVFPPRALPSGLFSYWFLLPRPALGHSPHPGIRCSPRSLIKQSEYLPVCWRMHCAYGCTGQCLGPPQASTGTSLMGKTPGMLGLPYVLNSFSLPGEGTGARPADGTQGSTNCHRCTWHGARPSSAHTGVSPLKQTLQLCSPVASQQRSTHLD